MLSLVQSNMQCDEKWQLDYKGSDNQENGMRA